MKRNHWLTWLLAVPLLVGFATAIRPQTASASQTKKRVNITLWHAMTGPSEKALADMVTDYNHAQSKVHVTALYQGNYGDLQKKIMAAGKSNTLPALGQLGYSAVADLQSHQLIQPITKLVNGKQGLTKKDFADLYPTFTKNMTYKKNYYTIPLNKSPRLLFYNKTLLKKYHLAVPKTWQDIANDGAKVKQDNIAALGIDAGFDIEFAGIAQEFGSPIINNRLKPQMNSKGPKAASAYFVDNIKKGYIKPAGSDKYYSGAFTQGKSLFYISSSSAIQAIQTHAPKDFSWGTAEMPAYKSTRLSAVGGADLMMFKGLSTAKQKAAWDFMKYSMSTKASAKWSQASGYVPVRKSSVKLASYKQYLKQNPNQQTAVDSLNIGVQQPTFKGYSAFRQDYITAIDDMFSLRKTPKQVLPDLQNKALAAQKNGD
ncbi:ABC-type sugar transport system periplasmic component [Furfurilactobacillus rossiae]|uniref:ABC transporter substrate-binding protein n=1 Tax=Furfurilactobacillus rossiae TaxID=231049 RepID=UPI0015B84092|nr:ABC transporter substrate-binding protein [Furfurilactobacillus rossiae]QLE63251.1 ABC-type sugar transport system periplasmic component [Furfurilactobacillus rossiae]